LIPDVPLELFEPFSLQTDVGVDLDGAVGVVDAQVGLVQVAQRLRGVLDVGVGGPAVDQGVVVGLVAQDQPPFGGSLRPREVGQPGAVVVLQGLFD
jgi:hypothetical protein